ncbi:hypothetical protein [Edaphobacter aggregans]|uniref:hypothetical protein n=1 Tax=Edaphobacter aggregans TaxID=570835 RepID=UPI0012F78B1F|nr:hypothetical protein [Edaphobacter aggregans]
MRPRKTAVRALCALVLLLTGCSLSPLARRTAAFSSATSLVVDNSENAYRAAVRLNDEAQASLLVARYDSAQPMDPHSLRHLIDPQDLEARTEVLDGLRTYARTIADLSSGVSSSRLDDAAAAVGANLQKMGSALTAATPIGFKITPQEANAASTALKALGEFLTSQKVKSSVPKIIQEMDPNIEAITNLLLSDIAILRDQSGRDYEQLLTQQDSFIRHAGKDLSPTDRRAEIQRLPQILARKQATDDMLAELADCVKQLALTHHALAAAATSKDAPSLEARITDLRAIGSRLASYYESLPTK